MTWEWLKFWRPADATPPPAFTYVGPVRCMLQGDTIQRLMEFQAQFGIYPNGESPGLIITQRVFPNEEALAAMLKTQQKDFEARMMVKHRKLLLGIYGA